MAIKRKTKGKELMRDGNVVVIQNLSVPIQENPNVTVHENGTVTMIEELCDVGIHQGVFFSISRMDRMVEAFKKLQNDISVPVMLGHDERSMYQRAGGPATGWVTQIWRNGRKLMGLLEYVPYQVYELIDRRAYARKSIGFGFDFVDKDGNYYSDVLLHLALLGEELPEVRTIDDLQQMYSLPAHLASGEVTKEDYKQIFAFCDQRMKHRHQRMKDNNLLTPKHLKKKKGDTSMTVEERLDAVLGRLDALSNQVNVLSQFKDAFEATGTLRTFNAYGDQTPPQSFQTEGEGEEPGSTPENTDMELQVEGSEADVVNMLSELIAHAEQLATALEQDTSEMDEAQLAEHAGMLDEHLEKMNELYLYIYPAITEKTLEQGLVETADRLEKEKEESGEGEEGEPPAEGEGEETPDEEMQAKTFTAEQETDSTDTGTDVDLQDPTDDGEVQDDELEALVAATKQMREQRTARAQQYGIEELPTQHLGDPTWTGLEGDAADDVFADPVNYRVPVMDEFDAEFAAIYFEEMDRHLYKEEQSVENVRNRLRSLVGNFGVAYDKVLEDQKRRATLNGLMNEMLIAVAAMNFKHDYRVYRSYFMQVANRYHEFANVEQEMGKATAPADQPADNTGRTMADDPMFQEMAAEQPDAPILDIGGSLKRKGPKVSTPPKEFTADKPKDPPADKPAPEQQTQSLTAEHEQFLTAAFSAGKIDGKEADKLRRELLPKMTPEVFKVYKDTVMGRDSKDPDGVKGRELSNSEVPATGDTYTAEAPVSLEEKNRADAQRIMEQRKDRGAGFQRGLEKLNQRSRRKV